MIEEKAKEILEEVLKKTINGKLQWERTHNDNTFQVSLVSYSIQITREEAFDLALNEKYYSYKLMFYNDKGHLIEDFNQNDFSELNVAKSFQELFKLARRSANKTEQALDDIIKQLKSDD